jgi:hypothetical protein
MPFLDGAILAFKLEVFTPTKLLVSPALTLRYPGVAGKAVNPLYAKNLNLKFRLLSCCGAGGRYPEGTAVLTGR